VNNNKQWICSYFHDIRVLKMKDCESTHIFPLFNTVPPRGKKNCKYQIHSFMQ